jgi:hypothetical protein
MDKELVSLSIFLYSVPGPDRGILKFHHRFWVYLALIPILAAQIKL